jgi:hypothetical protein
MALIRKLYYQAMATLELKQRRWFGKRLVCWAKQCQRGEIDDNEIEIVTRVLNGLRTHDDTQ